MTVLERRRDRLVHVLDLARMYRGWTRQEVAAALGREPSKMIPESGNPKLDLVMGIAKLLEWPVGDVAECLWGDRLLAAPLPGADAHTGSRDPGERSIQILRDAAGHRREGRDQLAIDRLQQGLMIRGLPDPHRAALLVELADAHGALWHLAESRALSSELIRNHDLIGGGPEERARMLTAAHATRGHAVRRMIDSDPAMAREHALAALEDLEFAEREARHADLTAIAHRAAGALIECRAEAGAIAPDEGVTLVLEALDAVVDIERVPLDLLVAWGWWCIYGANIARRHLSGTVLQRALGVFANKAMEIAEHAGDWSLRERAFSLDHDRQGIDRGADAVVDGAGDSACLLDPDDIRSIIGTMGRFPRFRETGWSLLRRAVIIE